MQTWFIVHDLQCLSRGVCISSYLHTGQSTHSRSSSQEYWSSGRSTDPTALHCRTPFSNSTPRQRTARIHQGVPTAWRGENSGYPHRQIRDQLLGRDRGYVEERRGRLSGADWDVESGDCGSRRVSGGADEILEWCIDAS
jgi:hypothetical protein